MNSESIALVLKPPRKGQLGRLFGKMVVRPWYRALRFVGRGMPKAALTCCVAGIVAARAGFGALLAGARPRFHCNLCDWWGWSFMPNCGPGYYEAASLCPNCQSQDRYRLFYAYLQKEGVLRKGCGMLDCASERRFKAVVSRVDGLRYVSLDLSSEEADVRANLERLPFSDETFDLIVCSHVLEHVQRDRRAMGELGRVLKKGGRAVLNVPLNGMESTREYGTALREDNWHWRIYGLRDYQERLRTYGKMECTALRAEDVVGSEGVRVLGLSSESILLGRKGTE